MSDKNKFITYVFVGLLIYFSGYVRGCKKEAPKQPKNKVTLGGHRNVKVKNNPSKNDKQTQILKIVSIGYTPPEGNITIVPKNANQNINDLIKIHRQVAGFTFEPGIQTFVTLEPNIGLDAKFFYLERFGLNAGFIAGRGLNLDVSPTISISYRLDRIKYIHNTEVFIGYAPLAQIQYGLGFRINL